MKRIIFYLLIFLFLASCIDAQEMSKQSSVKDIDGNVYKTIKIGNQIWMAENLRTTHYRNGDEIPCLRDDDEWDNNSGAYCYYNNDSSNIGKYGMLYNWFAIDDIRKIAPKGWHVPSDKEWQELIDYLGGDTLAGDKMKSIGTGGQASNESGFTALSGGYRYNHGVFDGIGTNSYFWSSTESNGGNAWYRYLYYGNSDVYRDDSGWKQGGYSVRCVKD